MNRFWKWTLGIVGILIVLAIIATPFALHTIFGFGMGRGFASWHGPMMYGRGFGPFGAGFFFLGGLVKLAVFGALLYGAYWLGRRNARIVVDPSTNLPAPRVESETTPENERKNA